jgi:hypothetical protein
VKTKIAPDLLISCSRKLSLILLAAAVMGSTLLISAPAPPSTPQLFVTPGAGALVTEGLAAAAPTGTEAETFQQVPSPGLRFVANVAQATTAPWIDSNAWRFQRGMRKATYSKLNAGAGPLAAAEAFTFGVDAILNPEAADLEELKKMLRFLKAQEAPRLPAMANIGVVDSQSPILPEILNLLARRNLLYKVVPAPDRSLDLTVQLGSADFPEASAANPSEFAARVRGKLGDDKRLVRLYGTSSVMAHLTGDAKAARLYLLSYGGSRRQQAAGAQQGIRVRVLGRYRPLNVAAYDAPVDAALIDVDNPGNATEFTLPPLRTLAIVDLERLK